MPSSRQRGDRLVGERARARDDADRAGHVDVPGMMPTLASPGVITPGQLGPIRRVGSGVDVGAHA